MIWLTGQLAPDFKTIADFRKDNGKAIREVCREFIALCRKLDLLRWRERCHRRIEVQGNQRAGQEFHRGQDEAAPRTDRREHRALSGAARDRRSAWRCGARGESRTSQGKIEKLKEEIVRLNAINADMMNSEDKQISFTDPDARSMTTSGKDTGIVGYNVQIAVDTEHHLIVAHEVTNVGTDRRRLVEYRGAGANRR